MQARCYCCDQWFRNVNERAKHAKHKTKQMCTDPELVSKRRLGKITHVYQLLRQLEKQQRPRKHGERHAT